ncbi:hypothetical protein Tco_0587033 [Tanacetum coccineum]
MPATPSPCSVNNTSSWIWCRSVILSVSSPNEPKSRVFPPNAIQETDNPCTTMEEYVQFETEKALRQGKVYNWETSKYGKISWRLDDVDINILKFFETKFPAIVYNDALKFESDFSSRTELNSELNDINLENETSLPECDKLFTSDTPLRTIYDELATDGGERMSQVMEVGAITFGRCTFVIDNKEERFEEKRCKLLGTPNERVARIEHEFDIWARTKGYIDNEHDEAIEFEADTT